MPYVVTALCHGKKNENVARHVQGAGGEENHRGRQETVATQCGACSESEAMNTVLHRNEIADTVSKIHMLDEYSSTIDLRDAILTVAAAVQAIIVEIEQSRSR